MVGLELILACAPQVAPETVQHIIHVESRGNPLAINVNARKGQERPRYRQPATAAEAIEVVTPLIAAGYSVDLGLMQVNSKNLPKLGYSVAEMFEPCTNISAGAQILTTFYRSASSQYQAGQPALLAALSAYNTGDFRKGFANKYVDRYLLGASNPEVTVRYAPPAFDPSTATTVYTRKEIQRMNQQSSAPPHAAAAPNDSTVVYSRSVEDVSIPGVMVQVDADEAERMGAFQESALSESAAWDANASLDDADTTPESVAQSRYKAGVPVNKLATGKGGEHGE